MNTKEKLKLHIFGHIHRNGGERMDLKETIYPWTHENPVLKDWDEMRHCVSITSTVDGAG